MTEIGPMAVEPVDRPGVLSALDDDYVPEVINRDASGVGELVVTNLGRVGSPLIRYRTGDLVKPVPGADGKIEFEGGILGRMDDMIHIRGNNIYPAAIEAIVRRFADVAEFRVVVDRTESLSNLRIEIECVPSADDSVLVERIAKALKDELLFRADVVRVAPGTLPRFEMKARRIQRLSADTH